MAGGDPPIVKASSASEEELSSDAVSPCTCTDEGASVEASASEPSPRVVEKLSVEQPLSIQALRTSGERDPSLKLPEANVAVAVEQVKPELELAEREANARLVAFLEAPMRLKNERHQQEQRQQQQLAGRGVDGNVSRHDKAYWINNATAKIEHATGNTVSSREIGGHASAATENIRQDSLVDVEGSGLAVVEPGDRAIVRVVDDATPDNQENPLRHNNIHWDTRATAPAASDHDAVERRDRAGATVSASPSKSKIEAGECVKVPTIPGSDQEITGHVSTESGDDPSIDTSGQVIEPDQALENTKSALHAKEMSMSAEEYAAHLAHANSALPARAPLKLVGEPGGLVCSTDDARNASQLVDNELSPSSKPFIEPMTAHVTNSGISAARSDAENIVTLENAESLSSPKVTAEDYAAQLHELEYATSSSHAEAVGDLRRHVDSVKSSSFIDSQTDANSADVSSASDSQRTCSLSTNALRTSNVRFVDLPDSAPQEQQDINAAIFVDSASVSSRNTGNFSQAVSEIDVRDPVRPVTPAPFDDDDAVLFIDDESHDKSMVITSDSENAAVDGLADAENTWDSEPGFVSSARNIDDDENGEWLELQSFDGEDRRLRSLSTASSSITECTESKGPVDTAPDAPATLVMTGGNAIEAGIPDRAVHDMSDPSWDYRDASSTDLHRRLSDVWNAREPTQVAGLAPRFCFGLLSRNFVQHMTYFRMLFVYFVLLATAAGVVIFLIERASDDTDVSFSDALFTSVSAITVTGLTVVDTEKLRLGSQITILVLVQMGGLVLLTVPPLLLRRHYLLKAATMHGARQYVSEAGKLRFEATALGFLAKIVVGYVLTIYFIAFTVLIIWSSVDSVASSVIAGRSSGSTWWALFHTISGFNNAGFSTLSSSLTEFQRDPVTLLVLCLLTILGNVYYPIVLRAVVAAYDRLTRHRYRHVKYCLVRPSVVYTHLFPPTQTRALTGALLALLSVEVILALSLDMNNESIDSLGGGFRVLNLVTQSIYTRTSGFNNLTLGELNIGHMTLACFSMVISAAPFVVTVSDLMPTTFTYNEDIKLELARRDRMGNVLQPHHRTHHYWQQSGKALLWYAKRALLNDLTWLIVAFVVINSVESTRLESDVEFSVFKVFFELASAYGTVGLSLGFPGKNYSFSGELTTFSKLVIAFVMILGRCRGYLRFITTTPPGKLRQIAEETKSYGVLGSLDAPTLEESGEGAPDTVLARRSVAVSAQNRNRSVTDEHTLSDS